MLTFFLHGTARIPVPYMIIVPYIIFGFAFIMLGYSFYYMMYKMPRVPKITVEEFATLSDQLENNKS